MQEPARATPSARFCRVREGIRTGASGIRWHLESMNGQACVTCQELALHFDPPKCEVNPFADLLFRLRHFVFPELLHRSGHDEERAMAQLERASLFRFVVTDAKHP